MHIEDPHFLELATSRESRIELWVQVLQALQPETMVEVGVWKGEFARQMLTRCATVKRYYMIDPWANLPDWNKPANVSPEVFDDVYTEAMRNTEFAASRRIVLRGRTREVINEIPDNSLDFAYIDGDHTLRGITIDLIKLLPKIKAGGCVGGDDFTPNPWQHDMRFEPTLVCPFSIYFAEAMDLPIVALPYRQFIIQKRHDAAFSFIDTTGHYRNLSLNKLLAGFMRSMARRRAARKM